MNGLKSPAVGNPIAWDSDLTCFGVRIFAAGVVTFALRHILHGRERRYTIGKHPDLSGVTRVRDRPAPPYCL